MLANNKQANNILCHYKEIYFAAWYSLIAASMHAKINKIPENASIEDMDDTAEVLYSWIWYSQINNKACVT